MWFRLWEGWKKEGSSNLMWVWLLSFGLYIAKFKKIGKNSMQLRLQRGNDATSCGSVFAGTQRNGKIF
jgi:hypothetical protein